MRIMYDFMVGSVPVLQTHLVKFFHDSALGAYSGIHAPAKCSTAVVYWKGMNFV